ncbi:Isoprimeverose transporter [Anaerolineales bacterium]|nr:Isoprimeverose transporter [Anaerolineales bacterium]
MQTSPTRSLPSIRVDLSFSLIQLGTTILWSVNDGWLLYFYLPPEGKGQALVPLALYGTVTLIARVANALVTPPIGYWSDHLRSRWGRRLPLMFSASLPLLIIFVLLWLPPVKGVSVVNLVYLGVMLTLFNVIQSFVLIPLGSLLPELAVLDKHRVRLTMWSSTFQLLGVIAAGMAGLLIDHFGFTRMALTYAVFALPLLYLPFLTLREQPGRQIDVKQRFGFLQSLKITLRNRAFLVLSVAGVFFWMATSFVMSVMPYIVTEVCALQVSDAPYFYIAGVLALLACYPAVNWLAGRFGKWNVFAGSLLASALIMPGLMLIGPWFPVSLMAQGIIWILLQSIAMSGITMLPQTFAAEITDYDEQLTGQRREGAYYSAWVLLGQLIGALAGAVLPLLFMLGRSQSDVNGPLGVRLTGLIGGVLMLVSLLIFLKYPLRHLSGTKGTTGKNNES